MGRVILRKLFAAIAHGQLMSNFVDGGAVVALEVRWTMNCLSG
jgi:hypothetical protein